MDWVQSEDSIMATQRAVYDTLFRAHPSGDPRAHLSTGIASLGVQLELAIEHNTDVMSGYTGGDNFIENLNLIQHLLSLTVLCFASVEAPQLYEQFMADMDSESRDRVERLMRWLK